MCSKQIQIRGALFFFFCQEGWLGIWLRVELFIGAGILWDATKKLHQQEVFTLTCGRVSYGNMKLVGQTKTVFIKMNVWRSSMYLQSSLVYP